MRGPELDLLRSKVGNKYLLVTVAAKRARQLMSGAAPRIADAQGKPVTVALQEIAAGKVTVMTGDK
ncbi:MAG: DNA-directed RNA polymerase subunit omega [Firmicutes bacterium]|jgi:DNA-directed RNA polymerase subunit omega|nr:DNA-directed RNA polymerase subunit omega [Bacillota bacterium]